MFNLPMFGKLLNTKANHTERVGRKADGPKAKAKVAGLPLGRASSFTYPPRQKQYHSSAWYCSEPDGRTK